MAENVGNGGGLRLVETWMVSRTQSVTGPHLAPWGAARAPSDTAIARIYAATPDNGWSLHGLETSLARQGKTAESAAARERFAKAWARADAAPTITVLAGSGSPPKMASSDRGGAVR